MNEVVKLPPSDRLGDLAREINAAHNDVRFHLTSAVRRAIDAGRALIEAKAILPHGRWLPWLKDNCQASERTAQLYMRLAGLVREMPETEGELAELTLGQAHNFLVEAKRKRWTSDAVELRDIECELFRCLQAIGVVLDRARQKVGDAGWSGWLQHLGIPAAVAGEYIEAVPRFNCDPRKRELFFLPLPEELRRVPSHD